MLAGFIIISGKHYLICWNKRNKIGERKAMKCSVTVNVDEKVNPCPADVF